MNKVLISITGATGIGKTKLSVLFANHLRTEIISADSRQFFKEMTIGTAVPSKEELQEAPHHFIQHKSILETYSVGDFEKEAISKLDQLFQIHDVVIIVGGSGLYTDAVISGLDKFPKVDSTIREELNHILKEEGVNPLQQKLEALDPKYFKKVDIHNPHRLIRALEICIGTGKPYSSFLNQRKTKREFKVVHVGLTADRSVIYERINQRVDAMITDGLIDEAKDLFPLKDLNSLQTVGYQELFKYFDGIWELEFAISEIKKNTRRFAKRQLTWFKKNKDTIWLDFNYKKDEALRRIENEIEKAANE